MQYFTQSSTFVIAHPPLGTDTIMNLRRKLDVTYQLSYSTGFHLLTAFLVIIRLELPPLGKVVRLIIWI